MYFSLSYSTSFLIRTYDVFSTYHTNLIFTDQGRLGIGTETPNGLIALENGTVGTRKGLLTLNGPDAIFIERTNGGPSWIDTKIKFGISTFSGPAGLRFQISGDGGSTYTDILHLANNGSVGIGTTNPLSTFHVQGNVRVVGSMLITAPDGTPNFKVENDGSMISRRIDVHLDPIIPDYVFHAAFNIDSANRYEALGFYKMKTLEELSEFVQVHRHLPGIKSAAEYQQEGSINLGELQVNLLEKVEELTLYSIELLRRIQQLEAQVQSPNCEQQISTPENYAELLKRIQELEAKVIELETQQ